MIRNDHYFRLPVKAPEAAEAAEKSCENSAAIFHWLMDSAIAKPKRVLMIIGLNFNGLVVKQRHGIRRWHRGRIIFGADQPE